MPGRVTTPQAAGPNNLIASGATVIRDAQDVLDAVFGAGMVSAAPEPRPLDGRQDSRFTYPMLLRQPLSGQLLLLYREGGPWSGELRVKRWLDAAEAFAEDELPLLSGQTCRPTAGPYINRPAVLPDGRVVFFCVWRLAQDATTAGDVANAGIELVVADPDLRSLSSLEGSSVASSHSASIS